MRRWNIRRRQFDGDLEVLNELYETTDPWDLSSDHEQERFAITNELIRNHVPNVASLLEVGCGEGLQTEFLLRVAGHVTGLEGAPRAVSRARQLLPWIDFIEADFDMGVPSLEGRSFTLVTLCEMLCHLKYPEAAVRRAQSMAQYVLVTIYEPQSRALEPIFSYSSWQSLRPIVSGGRTWRVYL